MTLVKAITVTNMAVSFFVWLPTWRKVLRTHRAQDFSLLSFGIVLYLQVSNLAVALIEGAHALAWYLALNAGIVAFTIGLIVHVRREY